MWSCRVKAADLSAHELLELNPDGGIIRFAGQRALLIDAVPWACCESTWSRTWVHSRADRAHTVRIRPWMEDG